MGTEPVIGTERVIVLGALSAIGEEAARIHAESGARLVLVGRNEARLDALADDLRTRGASDCIEVAMDLAEAPDKASAFADMAAQLDGKIDAVYLLYGVLGDQKRAEQEPGYARDSLTTNFLSAAEWCTAAANVLEKEDHGVLVVVSSVAGDRGRQSNYVYGAGKAGLTTLVEGIAHRLARGKARAVVAKLGFVDTPMTAHIEKKGVLWASPQAVAAKLVGVARKPSRPVVYIPWFWWLIMLIVRNVPVPLFHRTRL